MKKHRSLTRAIVARIFPALTGLAAAALLALWSSPALAVLHIVPSAGYTITWDGNDGANFSASNPALAPVNLARVTSGATPFANSQLGANHLTVKVNDGSYGNTDSWIANAADPNNPNPGVGVALSGSHNLTSISWGRDNGNTAGDCCGGQLMDRSLGTYTLQRTTVAAPGAGTPVSGVAATGWETIGTFTYYGNTDTLVGSGFSAFLRHEYQISLNGGAVPATGLRITAPNGNAFDEIEAYSGAVNAGIQLVNISQPGTVADNLALSSNGAVAFAKNLIGNGAFAPSHTIPNLNDGVYGNSNSWIGHDASLGDAPDGNPGFAGVDLGGEFLIDQIAFGRDSDGTLSFADRAAGVYIVQYTDVANPDATTSDLDWITLGTATYLPTDPNRFFRHLYEFDAVLATGVRLVTQNGEGQIAIDEIEVFGTAVPEPASIALWSLLGVAAVAVSARRLRRRR